jgi:hypothetical protein
VIDAGLGREDHSPHATATGRGLEPLDAKTDPQTKLGGLVGRIIVVKKKILRDDFVTSILVHSYNDNA